MACGQSKKWEKISASRTSELSSTKNNKLTNKRNSQKMAHQENVKMLPTTGHRWSVWWVSRGTEMPVSTEISKRNQTSLVKGIEKREPMCCWKSKQATLFREHWAASKNIKNWKQNYHVMQKPYSRHIPEGNKICSEISVLTEILQYHSQ